MIEHNPNIGIETSRRIAADTAFASTDLKPLIDEWVEAMAQQETLNDQQAVTGSVYEQVVPESTTPNAILRGELGPDIQQKFLAGALTAIGHLLAVKIDTLEKSKS